MSVVTLKAVNSSVSEASLASVPCRSSLSSLLKSDAYLYSVRYTYDACMYDYDVMSVYYVNIKYIYYVC